MPAIDDLQDLPLSQLFSGPLVAAIDASVQSQTEHAELLLDTGFDENGELITVGFNYTTREVDPETGTERPIAKQIEIPLIAFLFVPNLQINRIEETFSAEITQVEKTDDDGGHRTGDGDAMLTRPMRLKVTPSSQSTTLDRRTKSTFDLDLTMVAELQNESTGMEILERAASNAVFERRKKKRTERIDEREGGPTLTPGDDGEQ
ncbi:MAG: DUF2589 domain-containing protein [Halococcoides sp.]